MFAATALENISDNVDEYDEPQPMRSGFTAIDFSDAIAQSAGYDSATNE